MICITLFCSIIIVLLLLIQCLLAKQKFPIDPPYIAEYFHHVSTIDKPLYLRKHYGMQQSSIDFYPGTMNIILSVPHDGNLPSNLPQRPRFACRKSNSTSTKCYYQNPCIPVIFRIDPQHCRIPNGRDKNTRLLALALRYELNQLFRLKPFVIINRLERSKVDMNRFIDEGTFGATNSMQAWMRYHFYVRHARELIVSNRYNREAKGILFDIHSQDHKHGWVELGYMLTSQQLSRKNYSLKGSSLATYLTKLFEPKELISGNKSLGHFITKYNYSATPSPMFPSPPVHSYFDWGYTIEEYGRYHNFSAIMIESPSKELLNLTRLYIYAKSLASALHEYLTETELLEPLITTEISKQNEMNKHQCNHAYEFKIQINLFLCLFIHVIYLI